MTEQTLEQRVVFLPVVQVTFGDNDYTFPFSDLARGADDPATISDADLITRVANHMDRPVSDFAKMQVARPATGNIVICAKPTYGRTNVP